MFNFYRASKQAIKERDDARQDRDFWKAKAQALEVKLEERSDFFIEREFRMMDRFLTSKVKVPAITDEIRSKQVTEQDVNQAALDAYLQDQRDFLLECAIEAGEKDPESSAATMFSQNYSRYVMEFQANQRPN